MRWRETGTRAGEYLSGERNRVDDTRGQEHARNLWARSGMPTSCQSRCRCAPPPEKGIPSARTVRRPKKAWPLFRGIATEGAAQPATMGMSGMFRVWCRIRPRGGMKPPILSGGAQHPVGHRQNGDGPPRRASVAVGVARPFPCR